MASFSFNGIDSIAASFAELAEIDDDTRENLLRAGGEAVERHQKEYLQQHHSRTGELAESIRYKRKGEFGIVAPAGKHSGVGTGRRKSKRGRSHGSYSGTNAEVAYILEYGSPRLPATHWMEMANEEAEPDFESAMAAAWNEHLNKLGL